MARSRRRMLAGAAGATAGLLAGCLGSIAGSEPAEYDTLTVRVTYVGAWMATLTYHNQDGQEVETPIDGEVGTETTTFVIPDMLRDPSGIDAIEPPIAVEGPRLASEGVSEENPIEVEIQLDGEVVQTGQFTSMESTTIEYAGE